MAALPDQDSPLVDNLTALLLASSIVAEQAAILQSLAEDEEVGHDVLVLEPEPPPGAPHPGADLLGDKQGVQQPAQLPQALAVANRGNDHPCVGQHGLEDHGRDRAVFLVSHLAQRLEAEGYTVLGRGVPERTCYIQHVRAFFDDRRGPLR